MNEFGPLIEGIDHLVLTVLSLERTCAFYARSWGVVGGFATRTTI